MINAIGVCDRPLFVEKYRKRVLSFFDVFFSFEPAVDLLRGDEDEGYASFLELVVRRLELSQLSVAIGSPGPTDKDQHQRLTEEIREPYHVPVGR